MARYHPVSYETEARIRQDEKLANAHRYRQLKSARTQNKTGISLLVRIHDALVTVVEVLTSSSWKRGRT